MKAKLFNVQNLLYVALILALVSSLGHVAFAFATTNGNNYIEAYLSAIAVDVGLLALAAGINRRKAQRRNTWLLWAGVLMFSAISVYANWLAGLVHVLQLNADVAGLGAWLVSLRPILLSSVLPVLVIYLSEIVSDNHEYEQAQEAKAQRRMQKAQQSPSFAEAGRSAQQQKMQERVQQTQQLLHEGLQEKEIAAKLDVKDLRTVRKYIALASNGRGQ
jgi:hypothetical protein